MITEIVFGPPGTGKTTQLLECVDEELSRGTPPNRIGYITFTRRAAGEAITRACKKFNLVRDQFPYFRTLHSLCFRGLGLRSSDVLTGAKLQEFADYAKVRITGRWSEDGTFSGQGLGDRCLFYDNMSRVRCVPLREEYNRDTYPGISFNSVKYVAECLRAFKNAHAVLDYTDFLEEFLRSDLSTPDQLEVLIVDEGQDLSQLQWRVVGRLAKDCRRLIIAADDDQAIYEWAGADVECLLGMEGRRKVLHKSWRVPRAVQEIALGLVQRIKRRQPKKWNPREGEGIIESEGDLGNVEGDDVLILARNEYILRDIQSELRLQGIVYEYHGHSSIKERYLEAAEYWEALRKGKVITIDEARIMYSMMSVGHGVKRGFKTIPGREGEEEVTLQNLKETAGLLLSFNHNWFDALDRVPKDEISYMLAARTRGIKLRQKPAVRISTIHSAKGAEADHVILYTEVAKRSHREAEMNPDSELRVWYVGVTRAREKLTLVTPSAAEWRCQWL